MRAQKPKKRKPVVHNLLTAGLLSYKKDAHYGREYKITNK